MSRAPYAALASRIHVKETLEPVFEEQRFSNLLKQAFQDAGATQPLLSDPAIELIRMASKGAPRSAGQIIQNTLRLATEKRLNHLSDDIVLESIEILR